MINRSLILQSEYLRSIWNQLALRYAAGTLRDFGGSRVFFVDGINGNNANIGTEPNLPWQTITYALTQCTNDRDDYIFVLDCWQQEPAWPIVVNKSRVHIIGIANVVGQYPAMLPTDDNPVFQIDAAGRNSEIAGFNLSGGATNGCIELRQAIGVWIHHCDFGSDLVGGNPQDGIRLPAGNAQSAIIEQCRFFGTGGIVKGLITRDGIQQVAGGGSRCLHMVIQDCIFMGCPGVAINLGLGEGVQIFRNRIACDADTQGSAITLGVASEGCLIADNAALFGDLTAGMANNPYLDNAAAGDNHWMANYKGNALIDPA